MTQPDAAGGTEPDVMVVVAYGLILPQAVLDATRLGCLNVHASLLPRWRGAAPIQRAIEAGDNTLALPSCRWMQAWIPAICWPRPAVLSGDTTTAAPYMTLWPRWVHRCCWRCWLTCRHSSPGRAYNNGRQAGYLCPQNQQGRGRDGLDPGPQLSLRSIRAFNPFPSVSSDTRPASASGSGRPARWTTGASASPPGH